MVLRYGIAIILGVKTIGRKVSSPTHTLNLCQLACHRSDYMLHGQDSLETAIPLQVELNTIASSFGCLSSKVTQMHQHLQQLTRTDFELPENGAAHGIAKGLAMAL